MVIKAQLEKVKIDYESVILADTLARRETYREGMPWQKERLTVL